MRSNAARGERWRTDGTEEQFFPVEIEPSVAFFPEKEILLKSKERRWKIFILVAFISSLTLCIVAIVSMSKGGGDCPAVEQKDEGQYCITPGCVQLASRLINSIDENMNPCEDFFQYSCGKWNEEHPIPADRSKWSTFSELDERTQQQLKLLLDGDAGAMNTNEAVNKAKTLYRSCMNLQSIQESGDGKALELLKGWDLNFEQDPWGWDVEMKPEWLAQVLLDMSKIGIHPFVVAGVDADERNSSRYAVYLDQSGLGLPSREYYLEKDPKTDSVLIAYRSYIKDVILLALGEDAEEEFLEAQAEIIISVESELAKLFIPMDELRDPEKTYNFNTLVELSKAFPAVEWTAFLSGSAANYQLSGVVVGEPSYLSGLAKLFEGSKPSDLRTYIRWHAFSLLSPLLRQEYRDAQFAFHKVLYGLDSPAPRWRTCVDVVDEQMGFALGRLYVDEKFRGNAASAAEDMVNRIKNAFISSLEKLQWIDKQTIAIAKDKAESMHSKIAYPQWILHDQELNTYYSNHVIGDDYLSNVLSSSKADFMREWDRLGKPVDHSLWDMNPSTVNAYYNPLENEIVFPAGILQPPFFSSGYPNAANFGGIGAVVGHELTHGFDDQGRQFDKNGDLKLWWPQEAIDTFDSKAQCMVDQYTSYTVNGENVNGELTLGENIADNGGLDSSFHAYRTWVVESLDGNEEQPLPGVNFTPNQLFFLSYAQTWCGAATPAAARKSLLTDPHSPVRFRVNGPVSNSANFSEAFQCNIGAPMNPDKKCKVWQ